VAGATIPVHMGADRPLAQPVIDARYIHGNDGLGGAPRPAGTRTVTSRDGVAFLCRTFREAAAVGERADILMIGPLTNLALALRLEPAITEGIGQLTIMGGTVYGRGNTTPAAEFNIYADPEAASIVFTADIETVVAPWEPCAAHRISGADLDALHQRTPASDVRDFFKALSDHQRGLRKKNGQPDSIGYIDPLAAALVIDPTIVQKSVSASVGVALAPGIARGMTVVDPSGRLGTRKHTIVEEADQRRLDEIYAKTAAYTPTKTI
jgi:purine nucleosidase/non-specific riboncleoside hydrolase